MNATTQPVAPDPKGYEHFYLAYRNAKRAYPNLSADEAPVPESYGVTEFEAKFIRARVDRYFDRSR